METSSNLPRSLSISILIICIILSYSPANAGDHQLDWAPRAPSCRGSIAECESADEFAMNSEINRRVLATSQYISYEALKSNSVPCSRRGASYYNCQPGAAANPYTRGCSQITQCRS